MGQLSIQWPEFEPFDVEFALETKAKRVGVAELVMRTPWTSSQPSLELNVDVDGSRLPVAVVVKAQGAAKKVVVDVDVSIDPTRSVAAKTDGQFQFSLALRQGADIFFIFNIQSTFNIQLQSTLIQVSSLAG